MRTRIYSTLAALLFTAAAAGQSQQSYISNDPIAFSMGNTGVVAGASAFSIYNNSAAASFSENKAAFGVSYLGWQPDGLKTKTPSLSGYYNVGKRISLLLGTQYSFHKKQNIINENNEVSGTFKPSDFSLNVGFAYRLMDQLSAAVNVRYMDAKIFDTHASAVGVDVQMMYQCKRLAAALSLNNVGSEFDFDGSKIKQPTQLNVGASYELLNEESMHDLKLAAKVGYVFAPSNEKSVIAAVGAEYSYAGLISLRTGYSYSDKKKYLPPFATVGLGLNLANIQLNAGYLIGVTKHSPIKNSFIVGLSYTLF